MKDIESMIREMREYNRFQKAEHKYNRVQKILSSEKYLIEVFFHPQAAKQLGTSVDYCEVHGMKNVQNLFNLRVNNNGGIKTIRVYANGKPFKTINFSGNYIDSLRYKEISLF